MGVRDASLPASARDTISPPFQVRLYDGAWLRRRYTARALAWRDRLLALPFLPYLYDYGPDIIEAADFSFRFYAGRHIGAFDLPRRQTCLL